MRDKDKDRDPKKALKRAGNDLRCAVRKLGAHVALDLIADMLRDHPHLRGDFVEELRNMAKELNE